MERGPSVFLVIFSKNAFETLTKLNVSRIKSILYLAPNYRTPCMQLHPLRLAHLSISPLNFIIHWFTDGFHE
jgi:hypothetical protein